MLVTILIDAYCWPMALGASLCIAVKVLEYNNGSKGKVR
ncbi:hypothetical protein D034_4718 [Vibrio parahaemolyticus Peru-288]|nr:hypothetical protein D034_4718 [Vibrio parahaemolyticus Peru-288]